MANICDSLLSVGNYEDTEKFINAVKNGFTLDDETFENPFYEMDERQFEPENGKYPNILTGTTKWYLERNYIIALSKFLNTPVGCTNDEGDMICSAIIANNEEVSITEVDKNSYLKKHNLQDKVEIYEEDNYYDYLDDLREGLDLALQALFHKY
jgi:hypothetical protein